MKFKSIIKHHLKNCLRAVGSIVVYPFSFVFALPKFIQITFCDKSSLSCVNTCSYGSCDSPSSRDIAQQEYLLTQHQMHPGYYKIMACSLLLTPIAILGGGLIGGILNSFNYALFVSIGIFGVPSSIIYFFCHGYTHTVFLSACDQIILPLQKMMCFKSPDSLILGNTTLLPKFQDPQDVLMQTSIDAVVMINKITNFPTPLSKIILEYAQPSIQLFQSLPNYRITSENLNIGNEILFLYEKIPENESKEVVSRCNPQFDLV